MSKNRKTKNEKSKLSKRLRKIQSQASPLDILQRNHEEAQRIRAEAGKSGKPTIFEAAKKLALEAKEADPNIIKIYWFPHDEEVHLIEVDENTVAAGCDHVEPFYFEATASDPLPSGIAVIRPGDYRKLTMPEGWGKWEDGEEIEIGIK
jgi:hypothetical protein